MLGLAIGSSSRQSSKIPPTYSEGTKTPPVRAAAIDLGAVRVGLALTDDLGLLAHPRPFLDGKNEPALLRQLKEIQAAEQLEVFVLGLPRELNGREGPAAKRARLFAKKLAQATPARVELYDDGCLPVKPLPSAAQGLNAKQQRGRTTARPRPFYYKAGSIAPRAGPAVEAGTPVTRTEQARGQARTRRSSGARASCGRQRGSAKRLTCVCASPPSARPRGRLLRWQRSCSAGAFCGGLGREGAAFEVVREESGGSLAAGSRKRSSRAARASWPHTCAGARHERAVPGRHVVRDDLSARELLRRLARAKSRQRARGCPEASTTCSCPGGSSSWLCDAEDFRRAVRDAEHAAKLACGG